MKKQVIGPDTIISRIVEVVAAEMDGE
ncbi:MAG: hypothetical protein H6Q69_868, partial [Firmicutes bacterium]|nr:hypothetical protein [Bacillota bacterium]